MARDGVDIEMLAEGSGVSLSTLKQNVLKGNGVDQKIRQNIADYFGVTRQTLETGVMTTSYCGPEVSAALKLLSWHLTQGDFAQLSIGEDVFETVKNWSNQGYRALELDEKQLRQLFVLLNGSYLVHTSNNRFQRVSINMDEGELYVRIVAATVNEMLEEKQEFSADAVDQFSYNFAIIESHGTDYLGRMRAHLDAISSTCIDKPDVHRWIGECWAKFSTSFYGAETNRGIGKTLIELEKRLDMINWRIHKPKDFTAEEVQESFNNYFEVLRNIVRIN